MSIKHAKTLLITGGTGSLGRAILLRAHEEGWESVENGTITVVSRDETKQAHLRNTYPRVRFRLGDIRDPNWMNLIFRNQQAVVHAGAYKRVPSAEVNASETMKTNIDGSYNVVQAALFGGAEVVVGISTDKACRPENMYGASKRAMESLFQQANIFGDTRFTLARYGNVIGSTGSVIPLFTRLAESGKPITITHMQMTRFWITLDQAVDLVVTAGGGETMPGTIVVPKAPGMSMYSLAELFAEEKDLPIQEIGIRPGEKIHEMMVSPAESLHTRSTDAHFLISPPSNHVTSNLPELFSYTSNKPSYVLTKDNMRDLIESWKQRHG